MWCLEYYNWIIIVFFSFPKCFPKIDAPQQEQETKKHYEIRYDEHGAAWCCRKLAKIWGDILIWEGEIIGRKDRNIVQTED